VRLGSKTSREDEVGAQLGCEYSDAFPMLQKGSLNVDKKGRISFPWTMGKKAVQLERVADIPVNPPPEKVFDEFGCRFDATRRQELARDGSITEYCERVTMAGRFRDGPSVTTRGDGTKAASYVYAEGKLVSGTAWHPNGKPQMEAVTTKGVTTKTFYTESGQKTSVESDAFQASWYDDGSPKREWTRGSDLKEWYRGGQQSKLERADGSSVQWFENGQKSKELTAKREYTEWHKNGQIAVQGELGERLQRSGSALDSLHSDREGRQGVWTTWREDGTKALEAEYKDNRVSGRLTAFDVSVKPQFEQTWKGGSLQSHVSYAGGNRVKEWSKGGQLTLYTSAGKVQAQGAAVLEAGGTPGSEPRFGRAGRWMLYDENRAKESAGEYDMGGKHGKWEYWDAAGTMLREEVWSYGKLVRTRAAGSAEATQQ
jgi:antitoxin component YwqK of YwqJK toxin-antitoxin module